MLNTACIKEKETARSSFKFVEELIDFFYANKSLYNRTHTKYSEEGGYWLSLDGSSRGRSIETVKFYLALVRTRLPVYLWGGKEIADRIKGEAKIGIVPQGVLPCYCDNWFPGETVLDFMNLDYDRPEEVAAKTVWQPVLETKLN